MLEYMRKNANSTVVWLIIGAIAVVFIFFGVGNQGGGSHNPTVNGEEINPYDWDELVQGLSREVRDQSDSPEIHRMIKMEAMRIMVRRALISQFGRATGLTPSDRAVGRLIAAMPEFQTDGHFDQARYEDTLRAGGFRGGPAAFEKQQRIELLRGRVTGLIYGLSWVPRPEILEAFHFQQDQAQLEYAFFPSAGHRAGLAPGEDQLAAYFALHQERWRQPARMKIEYVDLRPVDFLDQVHISDGELRNYYQEHRQRFTTPETAVVSHILFKFPRMNPSAEDKKLTLARAEEARKRAATEDFAALAKELSEDPGSAAEGGALGPIGRGMTFGRFEEAIFSAPLNEVTAPVETEIGYHLIKVTERREPGVRPFEEVREALADEQKAFQARQLAVAQLEDLIIRTETSKLSEAAASMNLPLKTSESFTAANPPDIFEGSAEAVQKAFAAPVGRVASPLELTEHLVLYTPLERQESRLPDLAEVRNEVVTAWIDDEAGRLAKVEAETFIQNAQAQGWAAALAALPNQGVVRSGLGAMASRPGLVSTEPFQKVDFNEFQASLSSLGAAGEISPQPVFGEFDGAHGVYALALAKVEKADESQLDGQTGEILASVLARHKGDLMYRIWEMGLFQASEENIDIPPGYLE